jgi:hypothetical protein
MIRQIWRCGLALAASVGSPAAAQSQWSVAAHIGAERFWGGSVEIAPEHRSFRPYRPTTFGAGVQRYGSRWSAGLRLGLAKAALALEGSDALVAAKGIFTVYSATPEMGIRVGPAKGRQQLWIRAGPLLELWRVMGEDSRARAGAQGTVAFLVPLSGRFAASITAGAAITASPFEPGELEGYQLRTLWRRRFGVGLEYRL